jgi:alkaline phosphatase
MKRGKKMVKKISALALSAVMAITVFAGCTGSASGKADTKTKSAEISANIEQLSTSTNTEESPKYIFLFIGDGMSSTQINAAQICLGNNKSGEVATKNLNFTQFPVTGLATTYDSTSFCPDSASTATSISSGIKTHSGVIGMKTDKKTPVETIAEKLKKKGMKIGIVSSVTINHATPAAFYAHVPSRENYYDIALQLAKSNFDYFGGGTISQPKGKNGDQKDAYEIMKENGYYIADTKEEILAINSASGKTYAVTPTVQDSGAMTYALDAKKDDLKLADFVQKGIDNLYNTDKGFFMMCESGKIDWACHANDAFTAIAEVVDFTNAIQKAISFAYEHPNDTLILVTGDHETGGMSIGYSITGYSTAFNLLGRQNMSFTAFDSLISNMKKQNPKLTLADVLPVIKAHFGLIAPTDADAKIEANKDYVLSDYEYAKLEAAFAESMKSSKERSTSAEAKILYGSYDPLSVTLTHILNNKAGIGWTSYSHTGTPVPVYAAGVGAEKFGGFYDNTDIFKKLAELTNA